MSVSVFIMINFVFKGNSTALMSDLSISFLTLMIYNGPERCPAHIPSGHNWVYFTF